MSAPTAPALTSDVVYSYYPFVVVSNLANIPPQDVNFLETQGCLRVPVRNHLDEFLQQYFLHVHPLLPIVNEGDFWDVYCQNSNASMMSETMPLLLLQAILFASCNFVSKQTIKALGFTSIRAARASLYRRAKLLNDLETETSPLVISQAALLLSFWSPPNTRNCNTSWLSLAIQHAKAAEAHHYSAMPVFSVATHPLQHKKQNILKRLWWGCIIRDRTLGLLMRRPIQITEGHFDFHANPVLGFSDLVDEFERSKVYNPDTKRGLAEILAQIIELYVILTDIIMLVFPLDDTPGWGRQMLPEDSGKVHDCKSALRRWHKTATLRFPVFGGNLPSRGKAHEHRKGFSHDSIILYTNLMYMYYHSTRVVLCHHEILHLAIVTTVPSVSGVATSPKDLSTIYENRHELQDAATGVTECLKELVHLKLARWLPISAVACTALPLVLNILDVKLSAKGTDGGDPNAATATKQHRLNILIEAMKTYQPQYDGVDWVSKIIHHIINLAQLDGANPRSERSKSSITDWTDILASQPSSYLRLALALDLSLSKGRLPEDGDFPVSLRGLFTGGFSPLKALVEANRAQDQHARQMFPPSEDHDHDHDHSVHSHSEYDSHSPHSHTDSVSQHPHGEDELQPHALSAAFSRPANIATPPSEGLDDLMNEANDTFSLEDQSPSMASEWGAMYIDGPMPDVSAAWIETVWDEMGDLENKSDRDTARVLLEALKEGDGTDRGL